MMESRYIDKPIHPAMLNNGTPHERNAEDNAEEETSFLETHHAYIPGSEDNYTMMSPVGTLSHSLQGGWGIPDHFDPKEHDKTGFE